MGVCMTAKCCHLQDHSAAGGGTESTIRFLSIAHISHVVGNCCCAGELHPLQANVAGVSHVSVMKQSTYRPCSWQLLLRDRAPSARTRRPGAAGLRGHGPAAAEPLRPPDAVDDRL